MSSPGTGPFTRLVDGLTDDLDLPPAQSAFEVSTRPDDPPERSSSVDRSVDLQPEGAAGFAGLLIECWRDKRSGILRLMGGEGITSIYFDDGQPVFADSTDPAAFFGRMLVRIQRLTEAELSRAVNACGGGGRPDPFRFAEVLVESKLLDHQSVYELLLLHACETILVCFSFSGDLRARFGPGPNAPLKFPFSVVSLVREGIARHYQSEQLDQIVAPWVNRHARLRPSIDNLLEQLGLSPEEHKFLLELDGDRSLGHSSQKSLLPPLETARLVASIVLLDLVDLALESEDLMEARRVERTDSAC